MTRLRCISRITVAGRALAAVSLAAACGLAALPAGAAARAPCGFRVPPSAVRVPGSLPLAVVQRFAVLRRPATAADAIPAQYRLDQALASSFARYYPDETRRLGQLPNGAELYILAGWSRVERAPPARCLPKPLRGNRRLLRAFPSVLTFCLTELHPGPRAEYSGSCQPFGVVEDGSEFLSAAVRPPPEEALVPDGPAAVRLVYSDGETAQAPVSQNLLVYSPPPALRARLIRRARPLARRIARLLSGKTHLTPARGTALLRKLVRLELRLEAQLEPRDVLWLDAAGHVIRTIHPAVTPANEGGTSFFSGGSFTVPLRKVRPRRAPPVPRRR